MAHKKKISYEWVDWTVEKKKKELERQEREKKYESGELIRPTYTRKTPPKPSLLKKQSTYEFYESKSWKALRNQFVVEKKNENKLKCCVCGVDLSEHSIYAKKLNVHIHVDHITPIRRNWERRLDKTNLQILCNPCNWSKGNLDFQDSKKECTVEIFTKTRTKKREEEIQKIDRELSTHPDIDKLREKYKQPVIVESPEGKKTYRISKRS